MPASGESVHENQAKAGVVIIDLERFLAEERANWRELESIVERIDRDPAGHWTIEETLRFHYLYERAASDLARLATFSFENETHRHLETLVGRAYAHIHPARGRLAGARPWRWFTRVFPDAFKRRIRAFQLACAITATAMLAGALVISGDYSAKKELMPFEHLRQRPSARVAKEESNKTGNLQGEGRISFSALLMTHNIKVAVLCMAFGCFWGIGTVCLLFLNGIMLGAVLADYMLDGQAMFMFGWLLPHGVVEIPAILIAGQAGLVLGGAILGRADGRPLQERLRAVAPDLASLIGGVAVLLVWAGLVESFFSQFHEPVLPYSFKIIVGLIELAALIFLLCGMRHAFRTCTP